MKTKILSIILVIAMALTTVPMADAVSYPEGETPQSYEYEFNYLAHGLTASESLWKNQASGNIADGYDVWGYIGRRTNTETIGYSRNLTAYENHIRWSFDMSSAGYETQADATANAVYPAFNPDGTDNFPVFMLEIKVEKGGVFFPVLEYAPQASSAIVEVFLIKNETGKSYSDDALESFLRNTDPATRLGVVDLCSKAGDDTEHRFPSVELDDNSTYYLAFVANGINKNASPVWHKTAKCIYSENHFTGFRLDAVATGAEVNYIFNTTVTGIDSGKTYKAIKNVGTDTVDVRLSDDYEYVEEKSVPIGTNTSTSVNRSTIEAASTRFNYVPSKTSSAYVALKIQIPHTGKYQVDIAGYKHSKTGGSNAICGGDAKFYITAAEGTFKKTTVCTAETYIGTYHFWNTTTKEEAKEETLINTFDAEAAGDYWLVIDLMSTEGAAENVAVAGVTPEYYQAKFNSITLTNLGLTDVEKEEAPISFNPQNAPETSLTLNSDSAEIKLLSMDITSNEGTVDDTITAAVGSAQSVTANKIPGKEFLYWASGIGTNKKAVSDTMTYNFTAKKGLTYLTAVYRDANSDNIQVKFINGNGELINRSDVTYVAGADITMPTLPTMTGYGAATGWQLAGTDDIYTANETAIASGKQMIFVAQYDDPNASIDISVTGGTMKIDGGKVAPVYGDKVTVTASSRKGGNGYNVFAYWTKTVNGVERVVSLNKEYSFNAWENCELTAVYTECQIEPIAAGVRKILLGAMDGDVNIAEFIGCEGALERGILFGTDIEDCTSKAAMTTSGNHFSVINDSEESARAYAIFENGVIYSE